MKWFRRRDPGSDIRSDHEDADPREAEAIRLMREWLAATRRPAPPDFSSRVMERITAEGAAGAADSASRRGGSAHGSAGGGATGLRGRAGFRWRRFVPALVPGLAAAAVAVMLLLRLSGPDGSRPDAGDRAGMTSPDSSAVPCRFVIEADRARQVCLVGSFNRWAVCRTPLTPQPDGSWVVTLDLPPGRYEYMFVVDGRWVTDPNAALHTDDGFGNENAVLLL